jgi:hypothetical protein
MAPNAPSLGDAAAPAAPRGARVPFVLAALYLAYAAVQPPEGWVRLPLCAFRALSGLPCPGCGLTRSLTAILRGDLTSAWHWNPFGFLALPVLLTAAVFAVGPSRWIAALTPALRSKAFGVAAVAGAAALVAAGVLRAGLVAAGVLSFPG